MRQYLVFRLYGPMVAWGDIAVGEYRPSFSHPGKSAVMGLLAAARGIPRHEEEIHASMDSCYGFSVKVLLEGTLLRDYHTTQSPSNRKGMRCATRREELEQAHLNTILSSRDYRCDALSHVCLWARDETPPFSLEALRNALLQPRFPLYLGRRSCPPALPLDPRIVEAETIVAALNDSSFPELPRYLADRVRKRASEGFALYWDEDGQSGVAREMSRQRRDTVISRRRWQFADRRESYARISSEPGSEE